MQSSIKNDECSYEEQLMRSMGPGLYTLNTYGNDCKPCAQDISPDPYFRYQKYGSKTCPPGTTTNDESELRGLNYKNSNCSTNKYQPGSYSASGCKIYGKSENCGNFTEDTRLSNNACNLRGTGWNRWEWHCIDPQDRVLIPFDYNINNRLVVKDNHRPCIPTPVDVNMSLPPNTGNISCEKTGNVCGVPTGPPSVHWQNASNAKQA